MGDINVLDITLRSSGDMSDAQYKAVAASTTNDAFGCTLVAVRGGRAVGVFQDNSSVEAPGRVRVAGVSRMQAGDSSGMETAITLGTLLSVSSQGCAVPSTDTRNSHIGVSLGTLSTGSTGIIDVLLNISATSTA